jgi:acyl-coenzyme A thioesterase PaaI-like protein
MPLQEDAHDNWDLANPPEEGARAAKHRLVNEVKRLIDAVALLDVSDDDAAAVEAITARVTDAADAVAARPSHAATGLAMAHGPTHALAERSPFAGRANPLAAPMTITVDGDITRATATYSAAYEGPPNTLHGGFVAAAFDDLLGVAQMASGQAGFTGTLTVRMRKPTPLHVPITYEAGVERVSGRKIVCWGRSTANNELVAEAECLFVIPKGLPIRDRMPHD